VTSLQAPRARRTVQRVGDRVFAGLSTGAGLLILLVLAGVAIFLTVEGVPGILASADEVKSGERFLPYVWPLVYGTLLAAAIALLIAVPVAIGVALYISHYAPRRLGSGLGYLIDLLAAVPSVVYGLWGIQFLSGQLVPLYGWLESNLGFIPFFAGPASVTGRTILTAASCSRSWSCRS